MMDETVMTVEVLQPGALTTIQDAGRYGYQKLGVPVSGAMDLCSYRRANALLGNENNAAALEMTLWGGSYRFLQATYIALTGADMRPKLNGNAIPMGKAVPVNTGDRLDLSMAAAGCRTYLAVAGGIDVKPVMGSRSTYCRCSIGGLQGRALQRGDKLPAGAHTGTVPAEAEDPAYAALVQALGAKELTLRVVPGPQDDYFTEAGKQTFYSAEYTVTQESDRMGSRLAGPAVESIKGTDIISDGIVFGSIQITGAGKPIVLMADRQTTGGYAKIATVMSDDLPLLAQAVPGTKIRFTPAELK